MQKNSPKRLWNNNPDQIPSQQFKNLANYSTESLPLLATAQFQMQITMSSFRQFEIIILQTNRMDMVNYAFQCVILHGNPFAC